jgi:glycosyltransferase involved in cell wall biosynthesis
VRNVIISTITSCFKGERYLQKFLEDVARQTVLDKIEIVLAHNEPSDNEIKIVKDFQKKYPDIINHIIVNPAEPLSLSWNRCIDNARGKYVAIWNVDDLRTPNSLEIQMNTLDENPEIALTYGDFNIVNQFGKTTGNLIIPPEFEKREFIRSMHCGPFPMWRKEIHEKIGYFDEQLLSGADFDLMIRIALKYKMKKSKGLLGYFLNEARGASTAPTGRQPTERTVIELRYGIYDKIDLWYWREAKKYRIHEMLHRGSWIPLEKYFPNYQEMIKRNRRYLWLSFPKTVYRSVYNILRIAKSRRGP